MNKMIIICLGAVSIGFLMIFFSKTLIFQPEPQATLAAQNYLVSSSIPTETPSPSPIESITPTPQPTLTPRAVIQILKATYSQGVGVSPTEFNVKRGIPVRLEVLAKIDGYGCMGSIMIPDFNLAPQYFQKGETNIFEFTPEEPGKFDFTCAMGIPHGTIVVN